MSLSQKIDNAVTCYYYAKRKEPRLIGKFAVVNHRDWTYKELDVESSAGTEGAVESVSLELDDSVVENIIRDFGDDDVADVIARSVHFYDRVLDMRSEGFDGVGFVDKNYRGHIRSTVMGLPPFFC